MSLNKALLLIPFALPVLHIAAACCVAISNRWSIAIALSYAALATSLLSAGWVIAANPDDLAKVLVSPAPASHLIAVMIAFLGMVISRFSRNYLTGEARTARFATTLHLTLAAVALVVLTDHLLMLVVAWTAISLALHELLLFYPERPRAALAAHKKFLFARLAELALLGAALLLYNHHGTWQISSILSAYPAELSTGEQLAALLLAIAAVIKCAQLPMHGWLIQVVEAPTPVSALLHAGIINLGGYLMILFAPFIASAAPARWLLLVIAGLTTALASLIMTTRVTIKVKLAWSTTAQMGLMLVECALGLYELALLHLLAHACYKAYLFLRAGSAVEDHLHRRIAARQPAGAAGWVGAAVLGGGLSALAAYLVAPGGPVSPWLLLAAFLTVLLAERDSVNRNAPPLTTFALALIVLVAFVSQKLLVANLTPATATIGWAGDVWVLALIALICGGWYLLQKSVQTPVARTLSTWLYAGLYLDEWVTRTTLHIWPARLPFRLQPKRLRDLSEKVD